jgi:hypothetical protein
MLVFADLAVTGYFLLAKNTSLALPAYVVWGLMVLIWILLVHSSDSYWQLSGLSIGDRLLTPRTAIIMALIHIGILCGGVYVAMHST